MLADGEEVPKKVRLFDSKSSTEMVDFNGKPLDFEYDTGPFILKHLHIFFQSLT